MRKAKFDKRIENSILRGIAAFIKKYGLRDTTHAINKWTKARLVHRYVEKERQRLRARLAELTLKGK